MIAYVLLALVLLGDGPHAAHAYFKDAKSCEVARAQAQHDAVAAGVTDGSFICVKQETGKFS